MRRKVWAILSWFCCAAVTLLAFSNMDFARVQIHDEERIRHATELMGRDFSAKANLLGKKNLEQFILLEVQKSLRKQHRFHAKAISRSLIEEANRY
ncbi:MAG: hypothetical protein N2578_08540, partial [Bdellovibrionaceae bacterium]|nr:hypothetical protein [Pseudobdellovibrionaceae bacterium]